MSNVRNYLGQDINTANLTPSSSETQKGLIQIATVQDLKDLVKDTVAVTPAKLATGVRGMAVGVVAQVAGVPTGSIIESGSNANGEYIRFANGTQICSNGFNLQTTVANTWATKTITYPKAFMGGYPIRLSLTLNGSPASNQLVSVTSNSTGLTTFEALIISGASAIDIGTCYIAVGRWF